MCMTLVWTGCLQFPYPYCFMSYFKVEKVQISVGF